MPQLNRLDPDNVRIGENLRAAMKAANPENARTGLNWRKVALDVPMNHVVLARALAGSVGLAESKILRLAGLLGTHPGHLIAGITAEAKAKRFPHVPAPTNRNKEDTARKGMAVKSVEALVKNPAILSSFFGGIPKDRIPWFTEKLLELRQVAIVARKVPGALDNPVPTPE